MVALEKKRGEWELRAELLDAGVWEFQFQTYDVYGLLNLGRKPEAGPLRIVSNLTFRGKALALSNMERSEN